MLSLENYLNERDKFNNVTYVKNVGYIENSLSYNAGMNNSLKIALDLYCSKKLSEINLINEFNRYNQVKIYLQNILTNAYANNDTNTCRSGLKTYQIF